MGSIEYEADLPSGSCHFSVQRQPLHSEQAHIYRFKHIWASEDIRRDFFPGFDSIPQEEEAFITDEMRIHWERRSRASGLEDGWRGMASWHSTALGRGKN